MKLKNYNDVNNPSMIKELSKTDWFRMLRILRDHYSHFYNFGKKIEFPSGQPYKYLNKVSWNGLAIKKGQLGELIDIPIGYAIQLFDTCFNHIRDNEATL